MNGSPASRAWGVLGSNGQLVLVLALLGVFLLGVAPSLLVPDSWLALVAGREIVGHGLPSHDALAVLTGGKKWVDQQWLAQLAYYGAWWLGGFRLLLLANVGAVLATVGSAATAARLRGATARSTFLVTVVSLFVAPWSWQLRPQTLAMPLFVWCVYFVTAEFRRPSRRSLLLFPLLVLWANLHGSVIIGAALVTLLGVALTVREKTASRRSALFVLAPWLCVVASPYAADVYGYYGAILFNPPFARYVTEWQPARPAPLTAFFYAAALGVLVIAWRNRSRFNGLEAAILLVTFAEAVSAVRGIALFALAAQVLVPAAVGQAAHPRDRARARLIGVAAAATVVVLVAMIAVTASRSEHWFERLWPDDAVTSLAREPNRPTVFASDRFADWLLWRVPALRGRIAYDVRWELLDSSQVEEVVDFSKMRGADWARAIMGYDLVVLDLDKRPARLAALRAKPGARVVYEDPGEIAVIRLSPRESR